MQNFNYDTSKARLAKLALQPVSSSLFIEVPEESIDEIISTPNEFRDILHKIHRPTDASDIFKPNSLNDFENDCEAALREFAHAEAKRIIAKSEKTDNYTLDLNTCTRHLQKQIIKTFYEWRQDNMNHQGDRERKLSIPRGVDLTSNHKNKENSEAKGDHFITIFKDRLQFQLKSHEIN